MSCANHPETTATAYCRTCGKALCPACARGVRGVIYCEECLAARVEPAPAQPTAAAPGPRAGFDNWVAQNASVPGSAWGGSAEGPNPAIAGILSGFLPFGTGVMYCGEFMRALVHAGVFFGLILVESTGGAGLGDAGQTLFGLGIAFWYFFMIFDSVRVAKAKQRGEPVPDLFGMGLGHATQPRSAGAAVAGSPLPGGDGGTYIPSKPSRSRAPLGPVILIGLGVLFLLSSMDVFYLRWDVVVWAALILWGLFLIFRGYQTAGACCTYGMVGPAMIVTVGVLGLLDDYTRFDWGRTWPLFLIVLGGLKLLQMAGPGAGRIEPGPPPPAPAGPQSSAESQVNNG